MNTSSDFDYVNFNVKLFDESSIKMKKTNLCATHWLDSETIASNCYTAPKEIPASAKVADTT